LSDLIIDAGPLIGLFYAKDIDHRQCVSGFAQLSQSSTTLIVPTPIVYEVYKWLLHSTNPQTAQRALRLMQESLHFLEINQADFQAICELIQSLSQWQGTLEDLTVVTVALRYRCPVWTLNYRDFSMFNTLEFWNP
jgi:predicted nucleic acid-binding protein